MAFKDLDIPKIKKLFLEGKSASEIALELKDPLLTSNIKRVIQAMRTVDGANGIKLTPEEEASRPYIDRTKVARSVRDAADKTRMGQSQELVDKIDELTKDPKNTTFKSVNDKLIKYFEKDLGKVPKGLDPKNMFHENVMVNGELKKIFRIPRNFEVYDGTWGKRKPREQLSGLRELVGTKLFSNNPNFKNVSASMTEFYTETDSKLSIEAKNTIRKFNNDFSITRTSDRGGGGGISSRFFKNLKFDLGRKVKEISKIWTTQEGLKDLIKDPKITDVDKRFYTKELKALTKNRNGILATLKDKYPTLFRKDAAAGSMQLEHRVARSLGETGDMKLPKGYVARASFVPARFNQAKYFNYDKPLFDLVAEYNVGDKAAKAAKKIQIEKLTKNFNNRSGGFLDNVKFNFGKKINMTDSTPLFSKTSEKQVLADIGKNIKSSNKYFKSYGEERIKGSPKGSIASDFITQGDEYTRLKRLVVQMGKTNSNNICNLIMSRNADGGRIGFAKGGNCATQIADEFDADPKKFAQDVNKTEGLMPKVKNAATRFLQGFKTSGSLRGKVAIGAGAVIAGGGAAALVSQFRNDDKSTYLNSDRQMEGMVIADDVERDLDDMGFILDNEGKIELAATGALSASMVKQVYNAARAGEAQLLELPKGLDQETRALTKTIKQITHRNGKKVKRITESGQQVIREARDRLNQIAQLRADTKLRGTTGDLINPGKSGRIMSALGLRKGVLGLGLNAFMAPAIALPTAAFSLARDIKSGKSVEDTVTNPFTYLPAAFMRSGLKGLGKMGASRGLMAVAGLGLGSVAAAPVVGAISVGAGLATLGSLGYQGYKMFRDRNKTDEDFFN